MNRLQNPVVRFVVLLLGAIALAALFRWVSNLTQGDEYGAPYDLPAVSTLGWFGFLAFAGAAILLPVVSLLRVAEAVWDRHRLGHKPTH